MKTYLVTGAAGFIGANYIKYILAKHSDIKVVVLDALTYAGNLGTIAKAKMQAMETAAAAAKNKGIAVVLDPVGVMASKLRLVFALKLLNEGLVTIVRGNYAECLALLEEKAEGRGVDSNGNVTDGLRVAKDAAEKYNCVFAVTGVTDYVSNGKQALVLTGGHELLTQITGAGCMTTTLCACCAAVTKDPLLAAALGIVIMGQAAELAAGFMETKDGPGMFKTRLFDGVYHVTTKWNVLHLDPERKQGDGENEAENRLQCIFGNRYRIFAGT